MLATLLVAVGLTIEVALARYDGPIPDHSFKFFFAAFGIGGAIIGAGALLPFNKKAIGAGIGFVLGGLFLFLGIRI